MESARRLLAIRAVKALDFLILLVALDLTTGSTLAWSQWYSLRSLFDLRLKLSNILLFLGLCMVWHMTFRLLGLYRSRRLSSNLAEARDVLKATSLGTIFLAGGAYLVDVPWITLGFLVRFWVLSSLAVIVSRLLLRLGARQLRSHGRNLRSVLIIGTNGRALQFATKMQANPQIGYRIRGFCDEEWSGLEEFRKSGREVVCDFAGLRRYLRDNVVDEVVIALPVSSFYERSLELLQACEEQGITARHLADLFRLSLAKNSLEFLEDEPLITLRTGSMEGWSVLAKRVLDFSLSAVGLLALSPLFLAIAIAIKLSSKGPVFFVQERMGLNKRRFPLFKFRTMVPDAEKLLEKMEHLNEASGPVFKIRKDPRITRTGTFLRKTSLDELPQLINVLLGHMSLVGPRPLPVRDYRGFSNDWQRRRFSVRPGVTCLWQVAGRSSIPFEQWMEMDMQYIDEWSLWLDFKILARTIPAVVRGTGAA